MRGDETRLLLAIADGPVAGARTNDIELFEKGALVPVDANLGYFLLLIEADDIGLACMSIGAHEQRRCLITYKWKNHSLVGQKVVVQSWQVCSSARDELNGCLCVQIQAVATLYRVQRGLLLLRQLPALRLKVSDDCSRLVYGSQGRNVVYGSILGED